MEPNNTQITKTENKLNLNFKESQYATGRRKRSIARVWVKKGTGKIYVNGKEMVKYFKRPAHQLIVSRPLDEINGTNNYDVKCNVKGGGLTGQAGAIIHGISRALVSIDSSLKKTLKKSKLTTRDPRKVERKKYGHRKARRSFQFSKR
ncbi:MAG: 30S ribosomal protein S9 [Candidatus Marinimicrobia bacterium]|nr:30S ribosomal protein S9 [Candidatus Neomarinimicrobiota bacterium]|tara:strand:- start:8036 stop:8479 length:444 start_codon:yes stop_codon:yes gene_type:complete